MANKRVKDLTTDTSLSAGDYVLLDSASEGTRKFDLGTEIGALKDDYTQLQRNVSPNTMEYTNSTVWTQGYWAITNGSSNTNSRDWIKTSDWLLDSPIIVKNSANLHLYLQAWKKSDSTYVGTWNGTAFSKTYTDKSGPYVLDMDKFRTTYPDYKYKISVKADDNSYITPAAHGALIYFVVRTDLNTFKTPRFNIVSHRGYNVYAPENTIPAFEFSAKLGYKAVETDVQFTSDGTAVCLHDASINRTARNADGTAVSGTVNIADITYAQALNYDFGIWMGEQWAGTKIPTLEQFVKCCKDYGLYMWIELKNELTYTAEQIAAIIEIIKNHGMADQVSIISYDMTALLQVKEAWDSVPLGCNIYGQTASGFSALKTDNNRVFATRARTNASTYTSWISAGIQMTLYSIDTLAQLQALNPYFDGILTNCLLPQDAYSRVYA